MKYILITILGLFSLVATSQTTQIEHPRVMELEDNMVKEASNYFARRYPGDPFFIKVKIVPLRRTPEKGGIEERLPYSDSDTEEFMDEWDDPTTSLTFLRNRIEKIYIDVSVPLTYDEQKLLDIKQELSVYLRLAPFRDEVKIEKKLKTAVESTPSYVYFISGSFIGAAVLLGLLLRWSLGGLKTNNSPLASTSPAALIPPIPASSSSQNNVSSGNSKTNVQGDVTFHDPIKTLDIVHIKLKQIEESKTFPTFKDIIALDSLCQANPTNLGALVFEFSQESQKYIFKMGRNTTWLQAFTSFGTINQNCMNTLDFITRDRDFNSGDRDYEDLLIQVWRLGDKAVFFLKSIDPEHAFIILNLIPKSTSLQIAKKAFPGSWGKLLENRKTNVLIDPKVIKDYLRKSLELEPWFQLSLLENYKKDKELLTYLDGVNIEDEKDIYETLQSDSFILKVRPAFYRVFELEKDKLQSVIDSFTIDKWALVLINSSRNYIRMISDQYDDKKKMIFSTHLKRLDQSGFNSEDQKQWKNLIACEAMKHFEVEHKSQNVESPLGEDLEDHKHSA